MDIIFKCTKHSQERVGEHGAINITISDVSHLLIVYLFITSIHPIIFPILLSSNKKLVWTSKVDCEWLFCKCDRFLYVIWAIHTKSYWQGQVEMAARQKLASLSYTGSEILKKIKPNITIPN